MCAHLNPSQLIIESTQILNVIEAIVLTKATTVRKLNATLRAYGIVIDIDELNHYLKSLKEKYSAYIYGFYFYYSNEEIAFKPYPIDAII